jgi:putative tricarboxylic transport membrane protein
MPETRGSAAQGRRRLVRAPQDFAAGLTLVGVSLFALLATAGLSQGSARAVGPAMMPRATAVLIGVVGLGIAAAALVLPGPRLERWSFRGPFFLCLALLAFTVTIRSVGLAVAGPLVAVISGAASPDLKLKELLLFGIAVTAFSIALFKYALNLPIPVLTIPGVIVL